MRQSLLADNFRSVQQDTLFALLDDLYEDGPQIGVVTGPPGVGKGHALRQYEEEVEKRYRARLDRRRVITLFDSRQRFRAAGFKTREDFQWLDAKWQSRFSRRDRVSEAELVGMLRERGGELNRPAEEFPLAAKNDERPCPRLVIATPSQTTSENAMVKVLAEAVTRQRCAYWSVFDAHRELMGALQRADLGWFLIVDEAQRLKPLTLTVLREVYDDAKVSLVLVGTPDLEVNLHRRGAESLLSRISLCHRMEALDAQQVRGVLQGWDERLVRRIYAHTGGVFRRLIHLVELCEQIRLVNEESKITAEILDEAVQHIPDLLPESVTTRRELATARSTGRTNGEGKAREAAAAPAATEAVAAARRAAG